MYIVNLLVGLTIFYALPTIAICFLIKKIFKKKLSKGWCVLVFFISLIISVSLMVFFLHINGIKVTGRPIGYLELIIIFSIVKGMLYDKNIKSILDSEKELKEKSNKNWVKTAYKELENQEKKYKHPCFDMFITPFMNKWIEKSKNNPELKEMFESNPQKIKEWVIATINNLAGDLVESGQYHIYRGVLSDDGKYLFNLFSKTFEELKEINASTPTGTVDDDYIKSQIDALNENIKLVG